MSQLSQNAHQASLPPPGCLQWHTGPGAGTVANYNYKDSDSFHLSSQKYSICLRREMGKCSLCFSPGYFGLSNVPSTVPSTSPTSWSTKAGFTDSICCSQDSPTANCGTSGANDFIEIENSRASSASDRSGYVYPFYIKLKSSFFIVLLLVMVLATVADSLLWTPAQSVIKPELPAQFAPQFFHSE